MFDRLFQKVPWWVAALALHVVVLVQFVAMRGGSPLEGGEGTDPVVRLQALDLPEFGEIAAGKPRDPAPPSTNAIHAALDWLARHQDSDGGWSARDYTRRCMKPCLPNPGEGEDGDTGVSALAVLAFLGSGIAPDSTSRLGETLRRGLEALVARQDVDGAVGPRTAPKPMIAHLIATRALCLAVRVGATGYREAAKAAVDFTLAARAKR